MSLLLRVCLLTGGGVLLPGTSGVDLSRSLLAVADRLSELRGPVGGAATVLLLLCYSSSLSDADLQAAADQLSAINASFPELAMVAVTSDVNAGRFQPLVGDAGPVLVAPDSRAETVVPLVTQHLSTVPGRLVPSSCGSATVGQSSELELYLTPGLTTRMRMQPQYLSPGSTVTLQVQSAGYGVVRACLTSEGVAASTASVSEGRAAVEGCAELSGGSVSLNATARGAPLLLALTPTSSLHKCAEDDCRFPDQVRVTVRHSGLVCPGDRQLSAAPGASLPGILTLALAALLSLLLTAGSPRT
ncbi:uncharacterized protein LOC126455765 [Schistocerca serialis cubense]|uniref:uncharacterized protein LOC126455765 n=1 Tax=Schistocerca serialis cubense TaxID=2023355 RepID=UPI00214F1283|nr:uncharacterized protein LOC126455765 [Schistocerca serialis cubense]